MSDNKKNFLVIFSFVTFFFLIFLLGKNLKGNKQIGELLLQVKHSEKGILLSYNESVNASFYKIIVKSDDKEVYNKQTNTTEIDLDFEAITGKNYLIQVIAYDINNNKVNESKEIDFNLNSITFDKSIDRNDVNNKNYILKLIGEIPSDCYLAFYSEKEKIYEEKVTSKEIRYPIEVFSHAGISLIAILKNDHEVFDEIKITLSKEPITKITILSPQNQREYNHDNVTVKFDGGIGAEIYNLFVYEEDELIYQKSIKNKEVVIPKTYLYENNLYKVIITGTVGNISTITQKANVSFRIISPNKVKPVFASRNSFVEKGTKIVLNSLTSSSTIMYTLDGSKPSSSNGFVYSGSIVINEKTTIKAVAINKEGYQSVISTFEFIPEKKDITIYISPSKQEYNKGVASAGYGTEAQMMNKLADILVPKLQKEGYKVYRNNPNTDIMTWAKESKNAKADLHLALHSNGSVLHDESGVKTYIDEEDNITYSLAALIQEELVGIYHDKTNRNNSISFAHDRLGEVRPSLIPFGILLELGYHDNYNDAYWVVNNMEEISEALVRAINTYYGYGDTNE